MTADADLQQRWHGVAAAAHGAVPRRVAVGVCSRQEVDEHRSAWHGDAGESACSASGHSPKTILPCAAPPCNHNIHAERCKHSLTAEAQPFHVVVAGVGVVFLARAAVLAHAADTTRRFNHGARAHALSGTARANTCRPSDAVVCKPPNLASSRLVHPCHVSRNCQASLPTHQALAGRCSPHSEAHAVTLIGTGTAVTGAQLEVLQAKQQEPAVSCACFRFKSASSRASRRHHTHALAIADAGRRR